MTQKDYSDNLSEQIVNISKAGAFDIVSKHRDEAIEQNKNYRKTLEEIIEVLITTPPEEVVNDPAKLMKQISDICFKCLRENRPL